MYKHLLVPLDGSPSSESVLSLVSRLASALRSAVTLIHIIEKNPPRTIHSEKHLADRAEAEKYLARIANNAFPPALPVDCHVHEIPATNVAGSIVAHEGEFDYDLVIMSIHGREKGKRFILGNLAQRILAEGTIPVLFVKSVKPADNEKLFERILVPVDFEHDQADVFKTVENLAQRLDSEVEIAAVIETIATMRMTRSLSSILLPMSTRRMMEQHADDVKEYLTDTRKKLEARGIRTTQSMLRGDVARSIVQKSVEIGAGLIVMGTHGKTGTRAFWNESVSNKISSSCKMPVLLIPLDKGKAAS